MRNATLTFALFDLHGCDWNRWCMEIVAHIVSLVTSVSPKKYNKIYIFSYSQRHSLALLIVFFTVMSRNLIIFWKKSIAKLWHIGLLRFRISLITTLQKKKNDRLPVISGFHPRDNTRPSNSIWLYAIIRHRLFVYCWRN